MAGMITDAMLQTQQMSGLWTSPSLALDKPDRCQALIRSCYPPRREGGAAAAGERLTGLPAGLRLSQDMCWHMWTDT